MPALDHGRMGSSLPALPKPGYLEHGLKAWTFTLGGWEEWEGPSAVGEVFPRVHLPVRPE